MLSKEEIIKYQKEIDRMYSERKVFLALGLICLLSFIPLLIAGVATKDGIFVGLAFSTLPLGILFFILRSALYNTRIRNRKRLIQETKNELELDKLYSQRESDKKISL